MDNASLLAPITTEQPAGIDVSFSPEVDAIREMRREDDPTLDQGEWVAALKSADWAGVVQSCERLLATRSKDLQVAAWLVDARARLLGFGGLADGVEFAAALVDAYWDCLHPLPEEDDDDPEQRIGNLRWLGARVEQLVPAIPLLSHGGRRTTLSAINGARARRLAGSAASSTADAHGGAGEPPLTLERVWRDVTAGGRDAARERRAAVVRAHDAVAGLQTAVDARLDGDAPSFAPARAALDRALDELGRLERECGLAETGATSDPAPAGHDAAAPAGAAAGAAPGAAPASPSPDRIETRAQAVEQLRRVASFFRATEPHSPVAYLADKAVRWSDMPLHEWLRAVVKDGVSLSQLEDLLGVEKKSNEG